MLLVPLLDRTRISYPLRILHLFCHSFTLFFSHHSIDRPTIVELGKVGHLDSAALDECQLVHTVGTPLAVGHSLIPSDTYDGVVGESRVLEVVLQIWLVVSQLITPYSGVGTSCFYKLRSGLTKHDLQPVEVLVPVQTGHFVLVHVERTNGKLTIQVVTRSGDELILLTNGEHTTLDRHHACGVNIAQVVVCLKVGGLLVKVVPTRGVRHLGVQVALLTSTQAYHREQQK